LPSLLTAEDRQATLRDYAGLYLREEIQAEALSRNMGNFARFLETAALTNAEQVNYQKVGNDCMLAPRTVKDYFTVLDDTLVGHMLFPWQKTKGRKTVSAPKFYFFDVGVANSLLHRFSVKEATPEFGKVFEHFIFCELRAALDYLEAAHQLYYWRTYQQQEVDFVLAAPNCPTIAIEVKGCQRVSPRDASGLNALAEDAKLARKIIVSLEKHPLILDDGTEVFPVEDFLTRLWQGEFFS
jgi:predicted AAA+ superfamily ATPase